MRWSLIALLILLFAYGLVEQVWASGAHDYHACPEQSWDEKTGPSQFWWKTVTACNDHPAQELNYEGYLQKFVWTSPWSGYWRDSVLDIYGGAEFDSSWAAQSGFRPVEGAGGGLTCIRVRTHHFIVEWRKFWYRESDSYSWGQCY